MIEEKDPRQGLLLAAEHAQAELIVVGARGVGRMERLMMGSVATALVRCSPIPVLVVRQSESIPQQAPLRALLAFDGSPSGAPRRNLSNGCIGPRIRRRWPSR